MSVLVVDFWSRFWFGELFSFFGLDDWFGVAASNNNIAVDTLPIPLFLFLFCLFRVLAFPMYHYHYYLSFPMCVVW